MIAIRTRYHGPTDTRGARISATDTYGNQTTLPYPYALSGAAGHAVAVRALCEQMGWAGTLTAGRTESGDYWWTFDNGYQVTI